MVFVRDEGSVYDAPLDVVWDFFGSGQEHSDAHHHCEVPRERLAENSGRYAWVQEFQGHPVQFTMRWVAYRPLGLVYEVLEGPFAGSKFFLYYTPRGGQTRVTVVGDFTSPTIPSAQVADAVGQFFALECEQDNSAIRERMRHASRQPPR